MPQRAWSDKRERQYEHIKRGLLEHGRDEDTAEEIAARFARSVPNPYTAVDRRRGRSG